MISLINSIKNKEQGKGNTSIWSLTKEGSLELVDQWMEADGVQHILERML